MHGHLRHLNMVLLEILKHNLCHHHNKGHLEVRHHRHQQWA
jgi:hypothetical protein